MSITLLRRAALLAWFIAVLLHSVAAPGFAQAPARLADLRLADAVKRQERTAARTLLNQKVDVNVPLPDGATALHWAAHWDDVEMAALLLKAGANVNAVNDLGVTPLSIACANASEAMVARLLAAGANPNKVPASGETPLMTAARTGNPMVVKSLLIRGADANAKEPTRGQTALMWAAANKRTDVVRVLVEGGADVQARSNVMPQRFQTGSRYVAYDDVRFVVTLDEGGSTPLLFAARSGDAASASVLLGAGAKVDDALPTGNTPLVVAAHSGNVAAATLLLDRGADANAMGAGYTALHAAVLRGDLALVKALLAHGAKPDIALARGTPVRRYSADFAFNAELAGATPFWLAARYGDTEILRALADAGANTKFVMADGTSALVAAVAASSGFGSGDRRERYMSPVQVAERNERENERITFETVKLLLALGIDPNLANKGGDTAMHSAASQGLADVVELLAKAGASLEPKNSRGQTPLAIASSRPRAVEGGVAPASDDRRQATLDMLKKLGAQQ